MTIQKAAMLTIAALLALTPGPARAGSHTWDINEVFSDATGNIQFIELVEANGTPGETAVPGHVMSSNAESFVIPGSPLTAPTSNKFFLIATAGFAALAGAPTPDAIIPAGNVPFVATVGGDTIAYVPWDSLVFGGGVLPTNGTTSLNGDLLLTTGLNSPTNYAGTTGSVDASPPIPTVSEWGLILFALLLATAGVRFVLASRLVGVAGAPGGFTVARGTAPVLDARGYVRLLAVTEGVALASLLALAQLGVLHAWLDAAGTLVAVAIATYAVHLVRRASS